MSKAGLHKEEGEGPGLLPVAIQQQQRPSLQLHQCREQPAAVAQSEQALGASDAAQEDVLIPASTATYQTAHGAADHGAQQDVSGADHMQLLSDARISSAEGAASARMGTQGSQDSSLPGGRHGRASAAPSQQLPAEPTECNDLWDDADTSLGGPCLQEISDAVDVYHKPLENGNARRQWLLSFSDACRSLTDQEEELLREEQRAAQLERASLNHGVLAAMSRKCEDVAHHLLQGLQIKAGQQPTSPQVLNLPAQGSEPQIWIRGLTSL